MFSRLSRQYITFVLVVLYQILISVVNPTGPPTDFRNKNESTGNASSKTQFSFRLDNEEFQRSHYALNPSDTKRLALAEENLVVALSNILNNELPSGENYLCSRYIQKYINDFNLDNRAVQGKREIYRANIVTDNPNLTLRMIRRIVTTLLHNSMNSCKHSLPDIESTITDLFTSLNMTLPKSLDLEDALSGLLRIHFVYGFTASEISLGIFNSVETKAKLYFEDCLALGDKSIESKAETLAYQWLTSASDRLNEMLAKTQIFDNEARNLENSWSKLQALAKMKNITAFHELLHSTQKWSSVALLHYEYYATCRGESQQPLEYQSVLGCFHQTNWDPYFYINPVKTQVLSVDPLIYQFYEFVSDKTIDYIKNSVRNNMTRSGVISSKRNQAEFTPFRTSMNTYNFDENQPKLVKLSGRIEKLTGLEVQKKWASTLVQVARYGSLGGHYDFHLDSLQSSSFNIERTGDRTATFLMFLSDVKMGGYTSFAWAGTFAKPEKGSAIFWFNTLLNGKPDKSTRHGGCPVILGTKEIATRWINQYENMFKRPCALDQKE